MLLYCFDKKNRSINCGASVSEATKELIEGARCERWCFGEPNYNKAASCYLKAAELGSTQAQCNIGRCYLYGIGVSPNDSIAFAWLIKAAKGGLPKAQYYVGYCYELGLGVAVDYNNAMMWYQKALAHKQCSRDAITRIGILYGEGLGVDKDYILALKHFNKAAQLGDKVSRPEKS